MQEYIRKPSPKNSTNLAFPKNCARKPKKSKNRFDRNFTGTRLFNASFILAILGSLFEFLVYLLSSE